MSILEKIPTTSVISTNSARKISRKLPKLSWNHCCSGAFFFLCFSKTLFINSLSYRQNPIGPSAELWRRHITEEKAVDERPKPRVYGGSPVEKNDYPYLAVLFNRIDDDSVVYKCGGVILTPDFILTAAHCAPVDYVFTGLYDIRWFADINDNLNWAKYNVVKTIIHPNFNKVTLDNDLCLLQISLDSSWRIPQPDTVPLIEINEELGTPVSLEAMRIVGRGATEHSPISYVAVAGIVRYDSNDFCNSFFVRPLITNSMMCAFSISEEGQDACNGDSGGPLILKGGGSDGKDLLVGIVSWGFDCGKPGSPGVYARVSENSAWIKDNLCNFGMVDCANGKIIPLTLTSPVLTSLRFTSPPSVSTGFISTNISTKNSSAPTYNSPTLEPSTYTRLTPSNRDSFVPSSSIVSSSKEVKIAFPRESSIVGRTAAPRSSAEYYQSSFHSLLLGCVFSLLINFSTFNFI